MIHGDLLGERARLTPGKLALVDVSTGARLSYGELDARAGATARALRVGLSMARGDRVGLLAGNRLEYVDLFYAAGKSGLVLVPLGTRLTAHEMAHIVRDSGLRVLVYDGRFLDTVRALRELVEVDRGVAIDDVARAGDTRLEEILPPGGDASWTREPCGPDDLYALLYTSGTTGRPKGVMVPHRMVSWNAYNTVACWQLRDDDVSPIFTPLYHAGALGAFLLPMVAIGGTIVLHAGFDPAEVWATIVRERCTVVLGVPTIWKMLLEAPEFATADVSHVRWFISGGAPLPEYIAAAFQARGVVFKQGYGLTEVGVNCFSMTVEESVRKRGSIGKPLMMTEARLVGPDGREAPVGEVGELWLRGPHVSLGYWQNPDATAAALDADGWFHTGDLARRDEEGFYYIAGRQKDMFISGGVNVYPAEIEAELLQHHAIADAAVIGVPHPTWGEVGVAFVVMRPGQPFEPPRLVTHLETRLARYKIPKAFMAAEALPRTAYGKVQKALLQQEYSERGADCAAQPPEAP
jgi:fatty-acyl-CoA synthase